MNRDDIIRMAREAGLPKWYQDNALVNESLVLKFAALVIQHKALDQLTAAGQYEQGFEDGAKAEREECAKIAEKADDISGLRSALSIRLRGK